MEVNTFNEKFNELWNTHIEDPENIEIKYQIQNLIYLAKDKDSLVFLGESNPYEPLRIIPVSFDGEKEYIIMHNEKLLIYRDSSIQFIQGKVELSRNRVIVWPATCGAWILGGTDSQIEFVKKYSNEIGSDL
jgi:hypothetical protein